MGNKITLATPEQIPAFVDNALQELYNFLWENRVKYFEKDHGKIVKDIEAKVDKIKWPAHLLWEVEYDTVLGYQIKVYRKW
jgi:hypothetical protein